MATPAGPSPARRNYRITFSYPASRNISLRYPARPARLVPWPAPRGIPPAAGTIPFSACHGRLPMSRETITIFDTTLRDGEQAPGCSMYLEEKLRMARQLDRLGVDVIEAGFPVASQGDFEAARAVAREVRRPKIAALARTGRDDITRAWQAIEHAARPRIHTFLATSDIHLQYKLKITREQCLGLAHSSITYAKSLCDDVEYSPEDATRSDPDFLVQVLQAAVDAGATTLNIPDTVGYTIPSEYAQLIRTIRERVRGIECAVISVHCHNDLGLAVANSIAAIAEG